MFKVAAKLYTPKHTSIYFSVDALEKHSSILMVWRRRLNTGESPTRAFSCSLRHCHARPTQRLNNWLLQDWDPSCGTQVPAAKLMTLSFNTHSCLDRCVTTAQRSEEHTLSLHYLSLPSTSPTLSLKGGGEVVSVYKRLHSCLLLRTANVCSKELLLFKPWSEDERRDEKCLTTTIKNNSGHERAAPAGQCWVSCCTTVHTDYFWSYTKKFQPFLKFFSF